MDTRQIVTHDDIPGDVSSRRVQRYEPRIDRGHVHPPVVHSHAAVDRTATIDSGPVTVHVFPFLDARRGIQRDHVIERGREVHHTIDDHRAGLRRVHDARVRDPRRGECPDVGGRDLRQRRPATIRVIAPIGRPRLRTGHGPPQRRVGPRGPLRGIAVRLPHPSASTTPSASTAMPHNRRRPRVVTASACAGTPAATYWRRGTSAARRIARARSVMQSSPQCVQVRRNVAGVGRANAEIRHDGPRLDRLRVHDPADEVPLAIGGPPAIVVRTPNAVSGGPAVPVAPPIPGITWHDPQPYEPMACAPRPTLPSITVTTDGWPPPAHPATSRVTAAAARPLRDRGRCRIRWLG